MKQIIWTTLSWLILLTTSQAAGFDCGKAQSQVERLICTDSALSELDLKLAARYKIAIAEGNESEDHVLRDQQLKWLREIRNRCLDTACLKSAYLRRAEDFNWITKHAEDAALCEEFRSKKDERLELVEFRLEEKESNQEDVNFIIQNVDVDGDKVNENILLFRTGSASKIAPDNSTFTMHLSSSGKQFTEEAQGFYAIAYKSKYYLLTDNWLGESGPLQSDAYLLDRTGINKICSFECRLPSGQCGKR
jgi:uncharacterized protein